MSKIEIEIGQHAGNAAVVQEVHRVVALVIQNADERELKRTAPYGKGFDGAAVTASIELAEKRKLEHDAIFGAKP